MVLVPLIRILADSPGRPERACTLTPAICPCNSLSIVGKALFSNTFLSTTATDPVALHLAVCVYPVLTITSSNSLICGRITTFNSFICGEILIS